MTTRPAFEIWTVAEGGGNWERVIGSGKRGRRARGNRRARMQPSSSISCTVHSAAVPSPPHPLYPRSPPPYPHHHHHRIMQSLVAARTGVFRKSVRGFASSAARAQATPVQKPVLNKEFKIYRWVRSGCCSVAFVLAREAERGLALLRTLMSRRRSRRSRATRST